LACASAPGAAATAAHATSRHNARVITNVVSSPPPRIAVLPVPTLPLEAPSAQELSQFERLLADLSAQFVNLSAAEVDGAITDALRRIVLLLDVDRSQLIRLSAGSDAAHITHSWAVERVLQVPPKSLGGLFPWAMRRLRAGHAVVIPRVDDLPPEAAVDQASFVRVGVQSNLTVPMAVGGRAEGALALGCLRRARDWPADLVLRAGALATVFGNALAHKRAHETAETAIAFEQRVSAIA